MRFRSTSHSMALTEEERIVREWRNNEMSAMPHGFRFALEPHHGLCHVSFVAQVLLLGSGHREES